MVQERPMFRSADPTEAQIQEEQARYQAMSIDELIAERDRVSFQGKRGVLGDPTPNQIRESQRIMAVLDRLIVEKERLLLAQTREQIQSVQDMPAAETLADRQERTQQIEALKKTETDILQRRTQERQQREQEETQIRIAGDEQMFDVLVESMNVYDPSLSDRLRVSGITGSIEDRNAINSIVQDIKAGIDPKDISEDDKRQWIVDYMKTAGFQTAVEQIKAIGQKPIEPPLAEQPLPPAPVPLAERPDAEEVLETDAQIQALVGVQMPGDPTPWGKVDTLQEALEQAGARYLVSSRSSGMLNRRITKADIDTDRETYQKAIDLFVAEAKSAIFGHPQYGEFFYGADEFAEPFLIAWVKAKIMLEKDGSNRIATFEDDDFDTITWLSNPQLFPRKEIPIGVLEAGTRERKTQNVPIASILENAENQLFERMDLKPESAIGAGIMLNVQLAGTEVDKKNVLDKVKRKVLSVGLDAEAAHIKKWIEVTGANIHNETILAMGEPDRFGRIDEDKTPMWMELNQHLQLLGAMNKESIATQAWKLLQEKDKDGFVSAYIRQNLEDIVPDPMDREMLAQAGPEEYLRRFTIITPMKVDPDDPTQMIEMTYDEWFIADGARQEAPDILAKLKAQIKGLTNEPGREAWFYKRARSTFFAGEEILTDTPTRNDLQTMDLAFNEANKEFVLRGEIPGTFEGITDAKLAQWGDMLQKNLVLKSRMPPGMRGITALDPAAAELAIEDVAKKALATLEQRIGMREGFNQIHQDNIARVDETQKRFDMVKERFDEKAEVVGLMDVGVEREMIEAGTLLRDAEEKFALTSSQLAERQQNTRLFALLQEDPQLAQAFATGNSKSLRLAADARQLDATMEGTTDALVGMQRAQGLPDTGQIAVATPEAIEARQLEGQISTARQRSMTKKYDAEGNLIEFDQTRDVFDARTGERYDPTDVDDQGKPRNPISVEEALKRNPRAKIPGTNLPESHENRNAIMGGTFAPDQQFQEVDPQGRPVAGQFFTRATRQRQMESAGQAGAIQRGEGSPFVPTEPPSPKIMGWYVDEEDVERVVQERTEGIEDPFDQPAFQRIDYDPTDAEEVGEVEMPPPSQVQLKSTLPDVVPPVVPGSVVVQPPIQYVGDPEPELPPMVQEQQDLVRNMPKKNNGRNKKSGGS